MMHYNPWAHHHLVLDQYHCHYPYNVNETQHYYSSSDNREDETDHPGDEVPSDVSGGQSPNGDMFTLAFAASQWSKLVLNAEGLFNNLMAKNVLPTNELDQIEQWLCMKQEYEEVIAADDSGSFQGYTENTKRSLEIIEEVTETDEKTDKNSESRCTTDSENSEDEDQSEIEYKNNDTFDKLDEYMKRFRQDTDEIVASKKHDYAEVQRPIVQSGFVPIIKPLPVRNPTSRRMSILPYSEMSNEIANFNSNLGFVNDYSAFQSTTNQHKKGDNNLLKEVENIPVVKSNIDQINTEIEELQNVIRIKEEFFKQLQRNNEASGAKKKEKTKSELKKKYSFFKMQVAQAKNVFMHSDSGSDSSKEVGEYKNVMNQKYANIQMVQQCTVQDSGNAVNLLKEQVKEMKITLQEKEERKKLLQDQMKKDEESQSENNFDLNDCDSVRLEIGNLRKEREDLISKKCQLEKEYHNKILSPETKRELLRIREHIEFIDEMIEQKNEIICGRTAFKDDSLYRYIDKQMSVMIKVAKLSFDELMTLVCKYIYKVIDLKDSTRALEEQIAVFESNQDRQKEEHRNVVRKFEKLLDDLERYRRKNRALKKQLEDYHTLLKGSSISKTTSPERKLNQEAIPRIKNKEPMIKVTRQKNKLVITKKDK